jgi:glucose/mannose-6-phosphate isomerase
MKIDLDDLDLISRLDPSGMVEALNHFPDPLRTGKYQSAFELGKGKRRFRSLVIMGMGGSASAGDVVLDWVRDDLRVPAFVHRESGLPGFVNSGTLFIAVSYSGETSETLRAFREAKARRAQLIGIGTGGKLAKLCTRFHLPFIKVEPALAPRAALTQLVVATSTALEKVEAVESIGRGLEQAWRELLPLTGRCNAQIDMERNPAKRLAHNLLGHFLVLYSLQRMSSVARRFKNQLAENSKQVAKYEALPESCHNEIEAWQSSPARSLPVLIRDTGESSFERAIFEAFRSTIGSASSASPIDVKVSSEGVLSRLLCPILFLDYVSVYMALLRRVDPTPTRLIAKYKKTKKS